MTKAARLKTARPKAVRKSPKTSRTSKAAARTRSQLGSNSDDSSAALRLARVAKGRKPRYFADPATDKLLWMTLTLMEELSVTRDRLDVVERLLDRKRLVSHREVDGWVGDAKAATARAARRAAFVERMMRAAEAELAEATGRGMPVSESEVIAAVED
jgi:hypothetical protein